MVARAVRHVYALAAAVVWIAMLGGCADDLGTVAQREGVPASALVRLSEGYAVAARQVAGGTEVLAFDEVEGGRWVVETIGFGDGDGMTAHLVTTGGETGREWNSFFFGAAPAAASRVIVEGSTATGGQVADGAWVLAFRQPDLAPHQLAWRALDPIGGVIASGTGITR